MPLPLPKFEEGQVWDGTSRVRPNLHTYHYPDGDLGNRHSAEIIALENLLNNVIDAIELLKNLGAIDSLLGVNYDQTELEYKTLIQGSGMTITHAPGSITFTSTGDAVNIINNNASPIVIGAPVYCESAGKVDLAQADASATVQILGLVKDVSITASASGSIQTDGILGATTAQWDAVAGTSGGLSAGTIYYLSASTAGKITATAPTTGGQFVVRIGVALSSTKLEITLTQPIKL